MRSLSVKSYKIISIASCLVLSAVQFFLIFNTYKLKDEHYFLSERQAINNEYSRSIENDKLFPGGANIIDKYINPKYQQLEYLYKKEPETFKVYKQKLCDSIFSELILKNSMDSLLALYFLKYHFDKDLNYALTINSLDVAFKSNEYITLYSNQINNSEFSANRQTEKGYLIGGKLKKPKTQNLVASFTVSSPLAYSYRLTFQLYLDTPDRLIIILRQMLPTLVLSLVSILSVVILFYITFKNWIKQKKIADMKSDFVNSITHEFNTPLSAIIVANKNLQNEKVIEDKAKIFPLTEVIKRQSDRLQYLINQVLNVTTMNHLQLNKQSHEVHYLLDEILLDYRLKLTDPDIFFTLNSEANTDKASIDVFWFTTMLTNLFDNAIKYNTNKQKSITVTTLNNERDEIVIAVEDNGIGMRKEVLKHSFEKFYREAGILKFNEGLGLGLYYVKSCVNAHKWKIDIETKPQNGTSFYISIPLEK